MTQASFSIEILKINEGVKLRIEKLLLKTLVNEAKTKYSRIQKQELWCNSRYYEMYSSKSVSKIYIPYKLYKFTIITLYKSRYKTISNVKIINITGYTYRYRDRKFFGCMGCK